MLITADHGNAEQMIDPKAQQVHTAHTTNPVPLIYVGTNAPGADGERRAVRHRADPAADHGSAATGRDDRPFAAAWPPTRTPPERVAPAGLSLNPACAACTSIALASLSAFRLIAAACVRPHGAPPGTAVTAPRRRSAVPASPEARATPAADEQRAKLETVRSRISGLRAQIESKQRRKDRAGRAIAGIRAADRAPGAQAAGARRPAHAPARPAQEAA